MDSAKEELSSEATFIVKPFECVGDVRLGMSAVDIRVALGIPLRQSLNYFGEAEELWNGLKVCYSNVTGRAVEVHVMPPAKAIFRGQDLLSSADTLAILRAEDSEPLQSLGVILFLRLGLAVSGWEDGGNPNDRAVAIFEKVAGIQP